MTAQPVWLDTLGCMCSTEGCGGTGYAHCSPPCGGEQCICVCGGEGPCPGCEECPPIVCPGCYAVGPERCAPDCIDAEMARDREEFDGECIEDEEGYYGG